MRIILTLLVFAATMTSASAQVFVERFDYADRIFPPVGWVEMGTTKGSTEGWESTSHLPVTLNALGLDAAGHDDYAPGTLNDSWLITPEIDLSDVQAPQLVFDESLGFAMNLANHPQSLGDGMSQVLASTDGITWTMMWQETRTEDGAYYDVEVPLDLLVRESGVLLAFRYYGTYAHTWVIDDVRVGETPRPAQPALELLSHCGGIMDTRISNLTPGGAYHLSWGLEFGSAVTPAGPCAGVILPVTNPRTYLVGHVPDEIGEVFLRLPIPDFACGSAILFAFDDASCRATNTVKL